MAYRQTIKLAEYAGFLQVMQVDESVWSEAMKILRRYSDQTISFTYRTSIALTLRSKVIEALTLYGRFALFGLTLIPASR
jgi:hypothetical protein